MLYCGDRVTGGLIILAIGVIFLLRNLKIITQPVWSVMWPAILIVIGIGVIIEGIKVVIRRKKG
ncbi:MAG: DUF5668 domain-containing protein [bacterium]|nr:DUF5668 domain-containing protein [bacterium]